MFEDIESRLRQILAERASVESGMFRSDPNSIRVGHAFLLSSYDADRKKHCERSLKLLDEPKQLNAVEGLRYDGSLAELLHARVVLDGHPAVTDRIDLYLAAHGHGPAIKRELMRVISERPGDPAGKIRITQFAVGCLLAGSDDGEPDLDVIVEAGAAWLAATTTEWIKVSSTLANLAREKSAEDGLYDALEAAAVDAPKADDEADPFDPAAPLPKPMTRAAFAELLVPGGIIVVPPYVLPALGAKTDRHKPKGEFQPIAGVPLERVLTGDVGAHMRHLVERAPHLEEVYESLLSDTGQSNFARFRPTILVGDPGTGKSWSAREMGKVMSLPVTVFGCGGVADSTFGGTASHWSTSGPCLPLSFILQCRKSNPLIVLDEIEKAGTSHHNGRLVDVVLGFLDRGNAASYRDPSLEVTCDLSHVNYLLTANSLDGIPPALRDRCRIIEVPNPSIEHVPVLVRRLVDDIAADRGLDPRWYPPIAEDELDVIAVGWGGGSIRQLRRAVEVLLDGRDASRGYS